jgi:stage II sporulation protein D
MRRLLFATASVCALLAAASAAAAPLFIVDGRGWGHGIGMAQYGAYGYALKEQRSYEWILAHYYRGTGLGASPADLVRVLLADDRPSLRVGSEARFRATDANGRTYGVSAGAIRLGPALRLRVGGETKRLASPVRFSPGQRALALGGRVYRGDLVVRSTAGTLAAINHVGLEAYLYGVVPDEVPASWPMEALKAQAVAARSYAVTSRRNGSVFDLFPDTRSQVYGGIASEEPRTNAAVDATAGRVVVYGGRVAQTFFHSTSGGRTAANQDVWGGSPIPYLVSVPDPYDYLSPYHTWGPLRYTARGLASRLRSAAPAGRLLDATVARNPSGRAASVLLNGSRGDSRISGGSFQSRLDLRSTWFTIAVLSLSGDVRVELGSPARLRGIARGVRTATLERRRWADSWERVRALRRRDDGSFSARLTPTRTTWYRISSPKGKGLPHRVSVAAWVRFTSFRGRSLSGLVRPRVAGALVAIQRRRSERWVTVASARTTGAGRFSTTFSIRPGSYRAVATVGRGFVPGKTPVFRVVRR